MVYILLGCNQIDSFDSLDELCIGIVNEAKVLVDRIHADFPEAKIKVLGYPVPSPHGGCGTNYGAKLPHSDYYGFARFFMHLNIYYASWAKEKQYEDFLEFINISGQVDSDYAYPKIQKPVNVRSETTESMDTNGIHPTNVGYMQIADAVFRNTINFCAEKN